MMLKDVRVLIIEDNDDDVALLVSALEQSGLKPVYQVVTTREEMIQALNENRWQMVIADHHLPRFDAIRALKVLNESKLDIPFIILSGIIGEEAAVAAMKAGAHDYIRKDNMARLGVAIERELREAEVRQERRESDLRLRRSETRFRLLTQAGDTLASSLNYRETFPHLVKVLIPALGDGCCIQIREKDETLNQVAIHHDNLDKIALWTQMGEWYQTRPQTSFGPPHVASISAPSIVHDTYELEVHTQEDRKLLEYLEGLGIRSFVCVPLHVRESVEGTIFVGCELPYSPVLKENVELIEEVATRCGVAVESARLYQEAQNVNRLKDEFLATLSHELRTPLGIILGHAELLHATVDECVNQESVESIEAIYRNAKAQNQIINDLLDVSAIISGKIGFSPTRVSPSSIVCASVETVRNLATRKGITIHVTDESGSTFLQADPVRLQQVFWNLLNNAIKFTPPSGSIFVTIRTEDLRCVVEVRDTGQGIERRFLPFVFDRFRQEDGAITRKHGGLGLGLAIVQQLVEIHKGSVRVESPGKGLGTIFTVCLPLTQESTEPISNDNDPPEILESSQPLKGTSVLLVEDDQDTRALLVRVLESAGAILATASSCEEGLEYIGQNRPRVVVCDIGLPDCDGYQFIERLRGEEGRSGHFTPAIALTAYARDEDRHRALSAGFQMHLPKPLNRTQLIEALSNLAGC